MPTEIQVMHVELLPASWGENIASEEGEVTTVDLGTLAQQFTLQGLPISDEHWTPRTGFNGNHSGFHGTLTLQRGANSIRVHAALDNRARALGWRLQVHLCPPSRRAFQGSQAEHDSIKNINPFILPGQTTSA